MHAYGVVKIDGMNDSTASLIRRNLVVQEEPRSMEVDQVQAEKARATKASKSHEETFFPEAEWGSGSTPRYLVDEDLLPSIPLRDGERPLNMLHSRLVTKTYG